MQSRRRQCPAQRHGHLIPGGLLSALADAHARGRFRLRRYAPPARLWTSRPYGARIKNGAFSRAATTLQMQALRLHDFLDQGLHSGIHPVLKLRLHLRLDQLLEITVDDGGQHRLHRRNDLRTQHRRVDLNPRLGTARLECRRYRRHRRLGRFTLSTNQRRDRRFRHGRSRRNHRRYPRIGTREIKSLRTHRMYAARHRGHRRNDGLRARRRNAHRRNRIRYRHP